MASQDNALLYLIVAGVALYIYNDVKKGVSSIGQQPVYSREQTTSFLEKSGYTVRGSGAETRVEVDGGVVYIPENAQFRRWELAVLRLFPKSKLAQKVLT